MGGYVLRHQEWFEEMPPGVAEEVELAVGWFLERVKSRRAVWVQELEREEGMVSAPTLGRLARQGIVFGERRPVEGPGSDRWYVDPHEARAWTLLSRTDRARVGKGLLSLEEASGVAGCVGGEEGCFEVERGEGFLPVGRLPRWVEGL